MNTLGLVIVAALLLAHGLELLAMRLNLASLADRPPEGFDDVYDADTYRRSQAYLSARTRFAAWSRSFDLGLLLAFWAVGGFGWLDARVATLGFGSVVSGLAYVGALLLGGMLLGLPFRWWSTFVIEARFGFNRTTQRTFWIDQAKGALVGALLGGLLLGAVLALFERMGLDAWILCWAVVTAFMLLVQFIAPTWLMPLFNRFTPIEAGELRERILAYANGVDFPLQGVFVVDGSRRSSKANAFFTGFGSNKRIALYDTLIERHDTDEILAVVAHEVGHDKRHHVLWGLLLAVLHTGLLLGLFRVAYRPELFAAFGLEHASVATGLVCFSLLYTPVELVVSLGLHALSRRHEFAADRWAVETTGHGRALATALKKLAAHSLGNLTPHPLDVVLHHSHPPLVQRVAAIEALSPGPHPQGPGTAD